MNAPGKSNKAAVLGGGSWATAIAKILAANGQELYWWVRKEETVQHIRQYGHNPKYLSSVQFELPADHVSADINHIIQDADWLIFAVPSAFFTDVVQQADKNSLKDKKIVSAIKGITQHEHLTITQYLNREFGVPQNHLANISGPCHAEEVAAEKLSFLTFSSPDISMAQQLAAMFENRYMHTAVSTDLEGTEYASVIKNIYALAAGISIGLGYGDNYRAVLVSKGMQEMQYFLQHVCPYSRDIMLPPYLGDTLVTAYSQYSRNRTFGVMIGSGYTINSAILELGMVAEGYYASNAIQYICKAHNLSMPIADATYDILYCGKPAGEAFRSLKL